MLLAGLTLPLAAAGGLRAGAAWAAMPAGATAFDDGTVPGLARALAARAFVPQPAELPVALRRIGYDQYRDIRFDPAHALWRAQGLPFQVQCFHRGFLFKDRVDIHVVDGGQARPWPYSPGMFNFGAAPAPPPGDLGFAGFRLHAPINRADYFDEVCAFLGASYFRAVAKGLAYGLSARGLALGTGDPGPEEFPVFRAFWLEQPARGAQALVVHALLDSPSAAAALRFRIQPGAETVFDTRLRLYPRVDLAHAGIAPLTSMYAFAANDRGGVDDFRPAVHDSDGLAMYNGRGEQLWRPLHNPRALQASGFEDARPRGFGLMQRSRAYADFADTEANYQKRPSLWVEPLGDWGAGAVHLVEIPTGDEYHDNIVAFWRPRDSLRAGREYRYDYRLHWCDRHVWQPQLASVQATRIGAAAQAGTRLVVIDLHGGRLARLPADAQVQVDASASRGALANLVAHANPETGGWRMSFELRPQGDAAIELRALLRDARGPLSETWLYRWSA